MIRKHNSLINHSVVWLILIVYETGILLRLKYYPPWYALVINYSFNIALFYVHTGILLNYRIKRSSNLRLVVTYIIAELIAYTVALVAISYYVQTGLHQIPLSNSDAIIKTVYRGLYFIALSTAYVHYINRVHEEKKSAAILRSKLESDQKYNSAIIAQLQAQLNPHMMYNALQLLNSQLNEGQDKAKKIVKYLSQVFSYAITPTDVNGDLPLQAELKQVEDFISLQQYMYSFNLHLEFEKSVDSGSLNARISPLLLMTFVENLFKYGDLTNADLKAKIKIHCQDGLLHFYAYNKKRAFSVPSGKMGISNVKRLLSTKYNGHKSDLQIEETDHDYSVKLELEL